MGSKLIGCGSATPALCVSNDDLSKIVETSDGWIAAWTGIRNRRILSDVLGDETLRGLSVQAAQRALEMAQVKADDVDIVLLCTSTPDDLFGGAARVLAAVGVHKCIWLCITAACSGFIVGLITATCFINGGVYRNVLVAGADAFSQYVDWTGRGTCILFGDAAGAILVQVPIGGCYANAR